jgi:hypothetical protein
MNINFAPDDQQASSDNRNLSPIGVDLAWGAAPIVSKPITGPVVDQLFDLLAIARGIKTIASDLSGIDPDRSDHLWRLADEIQVALDRAVSWLNEEVAQLELTQ